MYFTAVSFVNNQGNFDRTIYKRGIDMIRDVTGHGRERDRHFGRTGAAPSLREAIQVTLHAPYTPGVSIAVRLRSSDLYLTSVHSAKAGFYFSESGPELPTKTMEDQVVMNFTGHYNDLGRFKSLERLDLGKVDAAITAISGWNAGTKITNKVTNARSGAMVQSDQARYLLCLCLILPESIRFFKVEETVANALGGNHNSPLTLRLIDELARDWGKLSRTLAGDGVAVRTEG